jgi:hypothetical protein
LALFMIPLVTIVYIACSQWKERVIKMRPQGYERIAYAAIALLLLMFGASQAEFIYFQF